MRNGTGMRWNVATIPRAVFGGLFVAVGGGIFLAILGQASFFTTEGKTSQLSSEGGSASRSAGESDTVRTELDEDVQRADPVVASELAVFRKEFEALVEDPSTDEESSALATTLVDAIRQVSIERENLRVRLALLDDTDTVARISKSRGSETAAFDIAECTRSGEVLQMELRTLLMEIKEQRARGEDGLPNAERTTRELLGWTQRANEWNQSAECLILRK